MENLLHWGKLWWLMHPLCNSMRCLSSFWYGRSELLINYCEFEEYLGLLSCLYFLCEVVHCWGLDYWASSSLFHLLFVYRNVEIVNDFFTSDCSIFSHDSPNPKPDPPLNIPIPNPLPLYKILLIRIPLPLLQQIITNNIFDRFLRRKWRYCLI